MAQLFETTCPNCRLDFDVPADAPSATCPRCATIIRLTDSEEEAAAAASDPKSKAPSPAADPAPATSARSRFLKRPDRTTGAGAVPIIELEGVGPKYAAKLEEAGIRDSDALLLADPEKLASRTQIPLGEVCKWQDMADLIHLKGIGPQFAEVLVRVSVNSVRELALRDPKQLTRTINEYLAGLKTSVVGTSIGDGHVKAWVKEARKAAKVAPAPVEKALAEVASEPEVPSNPVITRAGFVAAREFKGKTFRSECPRCRNGFLVAANADSGSCPACGLGLKFKDRRESDLITPEAAKPIDEAKLAQEAKQESERGFMARFARRKARSVVPKVELHEVRQTKPSLFRRRGGDQAQAPSTDAPRPKPGGKAAPRQAPPQKGDAGLDEKARAKQAKAQADAEAKAAKAKARQERRDAAVAAKAERKAAKAKAKEDKRRRKLDAAAVKAEARQEAAETRLAAQPASDSKRNKKAGKAAGKTEASAPVVVKTKPGKPSLTAPPKAQLEKDAQRAAAEKAKAERKAAKAKAKAESRAAKAKAKAERKAAKAMAKEDRKRAKEDAKAPTLQASAERQPPPPAAAPKTAAAQRAKQPGPGAALPAAKGGLVKRGPVETITCGHCQHPFTVRASQTKVTCPNCHSRLLLVDEGGKAKGGKPAAGGAAKGTPDGQKVRDEKRAEKAKAKEEKRKARLEAKAAEAKAKEDSKAAKAKAKEDAKAAKLAEEAKASALSANQGKGRTTAKPSAGKAPNRFLYFLPRGQKPDGSRSKSKPAEVAEGKPLKAGAQSKGGKPTVPALKANAEEDAKAAKLRAKEERRKAKLEAKQAKRQAKEAAKAEKAKAKEAAQAEKAKAKEAAQAEKAKAKDGAKGGKAKDDPKAGKLEAKAGPSKAGKATKAPDKPEAPLSDKKQAKLEAKAEKLRIKAEKKAAKAKAKEEARQAKLAAKGGDAAPDAKAKGKPGKQTAAGAPSPKDLKRQAKEEARAAKLAEKEKARQDRQRAQREAELARRGGREDTGLWAQAVSHPIGTQAPEGVFARSEEARKKQAEKLRAEKGRAGLAELGKPRLVDGRSLFARVDEDRHKSPAPRLPDGKSPFEKLEEDEKKPLPPPRLPDGRSAFEKLPEDEPGDYDRLYAFGHRPGKTYTTKGGFHVTEEVLEAPTAPELELGTSRDRKALRLVAKEDAKAKKAAEKAARKARLAEARADARKAKLERQAKGETSGPSLKERLAARFGKAEDTDTPATAKKAGKETAEQKRERIRREEEQARAQRLAAKEAELAAKIEAKKPKAKSKKEGGGMLRFLPFGKKGDAKAKAGEAAKDTKGEAGKADKAARKADEKAAATAAAKEGKAGAKKDAPSAKERKGFLAFLPMGKQGAKEPRSTKSAKADKLAAKEAEKADKLAAKEAEKADKLAAKEAEKADKLAAKEAEKAKADRKAEERKGFLAFLPIGRGEKKAKLADGDVAIIDIEGIGPKSAKALESVGIATAYGLRDAPTARLVKDTKLNKADVEKWQAMAGLLPIKGVGPQYSEVLVRSGVGSIHDLARRDAAELTGVIQAKLASLKVNVMGNEVTEKRVAGWIAGARKLDPTWAAEAAKAKEDEAKAKAAAKEAEAKAAAKAKEDEAKAKAEAKEAAAKAAAKAKEDEAKAKAEAKAAELKAKEEAAAEKARLKEEARLAKEAEKAAKAAAKGQGAATSAPEAETTVEPPKRRIMPFGKKDEPEAVEFEPVGGPTVSKAEAKAAAKAEEAAAREAALAEKARIAQEKANAALLAEAAKAEEKAAARRAKEEAKAAKLQAKMEARDARIAAKQKEQKAAAVEAHAETVQEKAKQVTKPTPPERVALGAKDAPPEAKAEAKRQAREAKALARLAKLEAKAQAREARRKEREAAKAAKAEAKAGAVKAKAGRPPPIASIVEPSPEPRPTVRLPPPASATAAPRPAPAAAKAPDAGAVPARKPLKVYGYDQAKIDALLRSKGQEPPKK